jgi:trk system potassium uptake protein TrkA
VSSDQPPHVVIVGCGRVGSGLAERMVARGRSVSVIDMQRSAFRRLEGLDVERVEGVGYDRETLRQAGIERAAAVAAVSNGDNSNIVVARVAREAFGVPRVFARIYDLRRAAVYERLGIPTVASAQLTIDMSMRRLLPDDESVRWVDPSANVCLVERSANRSLIGTVVAKLESDWSVRVAAVRRLGVSVLPTSDLVVQEGDLLYLMVSRDRVEELTARWSDTGPTGGAS